MMPQEYKGRVEKGGGYTTTSPRKWTEMEIVWMKDFKSR